MPVPELVWGCKVGRHILLVELLVVVRLLTVDGTWNSVCPARCSSSVAEVGPAVLAGLERPFPRSVDLEGLCVFLPEHG